MDDKRSIRNAKITCTMLGYEDHGILTCYLYLDYGGGGQGFGGYAFDEWIDNAGARIGSPYGIEFIANVLKVTDVEKWEDLPGKFIRVEQSHNKVHRIGNVLLDHWFDPEDLAKKHFPDRN
jgi:hypothetical protein